MTATWTNGCANRANGKHGGLTPRFNFTALGGR